MTSPRGTSTAAVALAVAAWSAPALAPHLPRVADTLRVSRRCADGLALTFDDGPHRLGTPTILDALARVDAKATFFVVGEQVERRPALLQEIVAAGHEVAVHGFRHRCQLRLTARQICEDLARAGDLIGSLLGTAPVLHRPAYGVYSLPGLTEVRRRGWTPMLWSQWGVDWAHRSTPASIASRATRRLAIGDVLLLHDSDAYGASDSWTATVRALPQIVAAMDQAARHRAEPLETATAVASDVGAPLPRPHRSASAAPGEARTAPPSRMSAPRSAPGAPHS